MNTLVNNDRNDVAWLEGNLATTASGPTVGVNNVESCDLGTAGAQSGASTGGLFLAYVKTTDNTEPTIITGTTTSGDSDGFDRNVYANAVLLAGTELGRQQIDNNFNEDDYGTPSVTGSTDLSTGSLQLIPVGTANAQLGTTNQPNLSYILFLEPDQASDGGNSDGLFLRTFDHQLFRGGSSTGTATDFIASFVPAIGTGGTTPIRLDHLTGGDVDQIIGTAQSGNRMAVIFREDRHDWLQATSDGRSVFAQGGSPNPALLDQERSQNIIKSQAFSCENDSCDVVNVIYMFTKRDQGFDDRAGFRGAQNF